HVEVFGKRRGGATRGATRFGRERSPRVFSADLTRRTNRFFPALTLPSSNLGAGARSRGTIAAPATGRGVSRERFYNRACRKKFHWPCHAGARQADPAA